MEISGAYSAERAAALAGVPKSTIYYWARKGHLIPSVSRRPFLWSYTDLPLWTCPDLVDGLGLGF